MLLFLQVIWNKTTHQYISFNLLSKTVLLIIIYSSINDLLKSIWSKQCSFAAIFALIVDTVIHREVIEKLYMLQTLQLVSVLTWRLFQTCYLMILYFSPGSFRLFTWLFQTFYLVVLNFLYMKPLMEIIAFITTGKLRWEIRLNIFDLLYV